MYYIYEQNSPAVLRFLYLFTLQVNHVGHFMLTTLLLDILKVNLRFSSSLTFFCLLWLQFINFSLPFLENILLLALVNICRTPRQAESWSSQVWLTGMPRLILMTSTRRDIMGHSRLMVRVKSHYTLP